ncbi:amino acid ABC transporter permease [Georgenia yuyongxinii]|uniref:Amino acid ABC transporter permease n=1 Tax=Georgenia yuyongxinii TaxID=2589797 RepID=A0A5B8C1N2_9MICO|nr:amino acid ABC transporter permease [Georgenia yuyongxinii]QDC23411.1 amino acid ABC transporter permease [Georgenia yuyongxinii]
MSGEQLLDLLGGLGVTLQLAAVSIGAGLVVALGLALLTSSPRRWLSWPGIVVVEIGRGAPVIVLLQLVYFGLPSAGITLDAMPAAWVAIGFSVAAYGSEIIRAALQSVAAGQDEAARALGLGRVDTLRFVLIPQGLRVAVPPLIGLAVQMFQATSLAFALSVPELLSQAYNLGSVTFRYVEFLAVAGVIYAVVALPLMRLAGRLERSTGGAGTGLRGMTHA